MEKNKKAVFFSTDAIIAITIILITLLVVFPIIKYSSYESSIPGDILTTLSSLKIGEINNSYAKELISEGKIKDLNKTILEQIGEFYVTNLTIAKNLGGSILNELNTTDNIGVWYGNKLIASKNKTSLENAEQITVNRQTISGISEGESVTGFSARAFFSSSVPKKYFYFGGYVGDGNISSKIEYNGIIKAVEIELVINKDFDLYINNIYSGHYQNSSSDFTPAKYDTSAYIGNFKSGENIIKFAGDGLHIAGGFIKISYENSTLLEAKPVRYYFPGIEGLINVYDGFYIPGNLTGMKIFLHLDTDYITFLNFGNITIYRNKTNGEEFIIINESKLSEILNNYKINYSELIEKTIPLRLGMENVSYITNVSKNALVFSVTDLSGSMSGNKINNAKQANIALIDAILNYSGNKVGLVGYRSSASNFHNLSDNKDSLKAEVNSWYASGGTCICCGINKASVNLESGGKIINEKDYWKVSNQSFINWTNINFDDSSWELKKMPGFANEGKKMNYSFRDSLQWSCEKINTYNLPFNNADCTSYATNQDYNDIVTSNDNRWITTGNNLNEYYESQIFNLNVSNIDKIKFSWEGHDTIPDAGYGTKLYVWNFKNNQWELQDNKEFPNSVDDELLSELYKTNDYINNSQISFLITHKHYSGSSCPYVYSWNGSEYIFDSEGLTTYPLFEESEGKQPSKLYSLKPDNTEYKIKITEELAEDSFIDSVELIRIPHSKNIEVYPVLNRPRELNFIGLDIPIEFIYNLRYYQNKLSDKLAINPDFLYYFETIEEPKKPIKAIENNESVQSIIEEDNIFWNKNFNQEAIFTNESLYHYVELTYEKPKNAKKAKLLIKYKEDNFLSWFGARILSGFNKFEIKKEKERLYNRVVEDFSVIIEIWDGENWIYGNNLLDFPREKPSKMIIPLDIESIKTDYLKIRLKAIPKTMLIDSVFIDYSKTPNLEINKINLKKALKNNEDVKETVSYTDKKRIVLNGSSKDSVELIFDNNEVYNSEENSFFLNIRGYYVPYQFELDSMKNKYFIEELLNNKEKIHRDLLPLYLSSNKEKNSLATDYVSFSEIIVPKGEWYLRKEFNLTELSSISTAYILMDDKAEIYLNEELIFNATKNYNGTHWDETIPINTEKLKLGKNIIAAKLINNDNSFIGFDMELLIEYTNKLKSMIVMSDGWANGFCLEQGTGSASQDAIQAACDAFQDYGITVHAVGFGSGVDENTLKGIANCGNGSYYYSDVNEITKIYQQIAKEIIEASFSEQTLISTKGVLTKIFPDSYIEFNYSKKEFPYGLITVNEKQFSSSYNGYFNIPDNSSVLDVKAISYSGPRWTDNVEINNNSIYKLSDYGGEYIKLGDPYSINILPSLVLLDNNVKITTGLYPGNSSEGSISNKIIYTIIRNFTSFSSISAFANGCNWIVDFEDGTNLTLKIPKDYQETNICHYQDGVKDYDNNDAIQTAVYSLFNSLDFNSNGKIDIKFTEQDFQVSSSEITGIPFSWSTEVQIRRWN